MSTPIALKGHKHICPLCQGPVPHVGGVITEGDPNFTVNGVPVALQGHACACQTGENNAIIQGHSSMTFNGVPVAYKGSLTAHGGAVIEGDDALTVD